jgi:hypothetical protein
LVGVFTRERKSVPDAGDQSVISHDEIAKKDYADAAAPSAR